MKCLIRADGNASMGTGHVMRCLSLAQAWPGKAIFALAESTPGLKQRLQAEGFTFIESADTAQRGTAEKRRQDGCGSRFGSYS